MPIEGISNVVRFSRAGHLRLGVKRVSKNGKEYPAASDHFVADFQDARAAKQFHDLYGPEPKRVTIAFASEDDEINFPQYYKAYGSGAGLKCKGDGVKARRTGEQGARFDCPCPGPDGCDFGRQAGCRAVATMQYFIKGIEGLNVFQTSTGSINSIIAVNSGIKLLRMLRGRQGIAGVWVDLFLHPETVQTDEGQKTIHVLRLHIAADITSGQQLESAFDRPLELPAPVPERPDVVVEPPDEETDPEFPEAEAKVIPPREELLKALVAYCDREQIDRKTFAIPMRKHFSVNRIDDLTDAQILEYMELHEIPIDDIPF